MQQHTVAGQEMLDKVGGSMTDVGVIVRASHERWDGGGYPDGTAGEEIPLAARVVAVADTFSAITTTRSYRRAQTPEAAAEELRECAGTQFDPQVVAALVARARASGARDAGGVSRAGVVRRVHRRPCRAGAGTCSRPASCSALRSSSPADAAVDIAVMTIARSLAALDELPEATVALNPIRGAGGAIVDLVFAYANRRAGEIAQMAPGQLVGLRIHDALPAFPPELFAGFVAVLEGGPALRTEITYGDRLDGRKPFSMRFEVSASRLGDGLLVAYDDVGERERVQALERRYGAVLEATSDWVSIADGDNNLVYINSAGRQYDRPGTSTRTSPAGGSASSRPRGRASACTARRSPSRAARASGAARARGCTATATRSPRRRSSSRA